MLDETGVGQPHERGAEPMVGRREELRAIEAAVAGPGGRSVVLVGEAGIGKTRLLKAGMEIAAGAAWTVVHAAGSERESGAPFAFAAGLVRRLAPQDPASDLVRRLLDQGGAPNVNTHPSAGATTEEICHALFRHLARNVDQDRLLIVVDDLQWVDPGSVAVLEHLMERLEHLPITILTAVRREASRGAELIVRLGEIPTVTVLKLGPLPLEATRVLVRTVMVDADEDEIVALHRACGGVPFALRALLREGRPREEIVATDDLVAPGAVARDTVARIADLDADGQALAQAMAVLGGAQPLGLAGTLAGLDEGRVARAALKLISAGLLGPGEPLMWSHPLMGQAAYAALTERQRTALHRRAAELLERDGRSATVVAAHLEQVTPSGDRALAARLVEVADAASAAGQPMAAARLYQRALNEPAPRALASGVEARLGGALADANDERALTVLARVRDRGTASIDRARAGLRLAETAYGFGRLGEAVDAADAALRERAGDPALDRELEAIACRAGRHDLDRRPAALERLERLLETPRAPGPNERGLRAESALEQVITVAAGAAAAAASAEAALDDGALLAAETAAGSGWFLCCYALHVAEYNGAAFQTLDAAVSDARQRGSVAGFAQSVALRSGPRMHLGRFRDAAADAEAALAAAPVPRLLYRPAVLSTLIQLRLLLGDRDGAKAAAAEGGEDRAPEQATWMHFLYARGVLALDEGRAQDALRDASAAGAAQAQGGGDNPAMLAWRSLAARALGQLGRIDEGRRLAEEELRLAEAFGASAAIGHARAAVAVLADDPQTRIALLRRAVAEMERGERVHLLLDALMTLGRTLLEQGEPVAAREPFGRALHLADAGGANAVRDAAREALVAAGGRPRRPALAGPASLTPTERDVAGRAAGGATNRQIAEDLFVSVKTVEWHLSATYRKLGITSRRALRAALDPC